MKKNILQALRAGLKNKLKVNYPKLDDFAPSARVLIPKNISIKATTTDKLGFIGNKEGIAAITTCLITKHD